MPPDILSSYKYSTVGAILPRTARNPRSFADTTVILPRVLHSGMCKYCAYNFHDGWTQLLQYDDVYQDAVAPETGSNYGFHDSYQDLREQI
jgi:hypothetical protein